jgi:hypothetical protein
MGRAYEPAVEHLPPEHLDPELDALLRERRPMPDQRWVAATERRLLPEPRVRWRWRPSPVLRMGAALAVALTFVVLALSLFGGGPLGASTGDVKAGDECRTVTVTRTERVPAIVEDSTGEPRVVYRRERVQRPVERCD